MTYKIYYTHSLSRNCGSHECNFIYVPIKSKIILVDLLMTYQVQQGTRGSLAASRAAHLSTPE